VLKKALKKFTTPVSVLDKEDLQQFCSLQHGTTPIDQLQPRQEADVVGEIKNLRVVPKPNGTSWLEASVTDGSGTLTVMWTGRRKIAGVKPGARLQVGGRAAPNGPGKRLLMINPRYELL
jgi:hypothetical protein